MTKVSIGWVVINPKTNKPTRTGPSFGAKTSKVYDTLAKAKQVASLRGFSHDWIKEAFVEVRHEG